MKKTRTLIALLALAGGLALAPTLAADEGTLITVARNGHTVTITSANDAKAAQSAKGGKAGAKQAPAADPESGAGAGNAADDAADDGDGHRHDDAVVAIGHDAVLEAGKSAEAVVAVFGNANNAGEAREAVVAVLGDATSTGTVGEAVVSVFGTAHVDGTAHGVVALGTVVLGPHAVVEGDVVTVGGPLVRDPAAVVTGQVQEVNVFGAEHARSIGDGLHAWVTHCLLLGRPLAFGPHLGWLWMIAAVSIACYLLIVLLFPGAVYQCVDTMEQRPGRSLVAAILAVPLKWVALALLVITGIGILLLPFAAMGLWMAKLLGKAAAYAWIGRRVLPHDGERRPGPLLLATLVGALLATAFYVIPFVGGLMHWGVGVLGLGIVVYTVILRMFPAKRSPGVGGYGGPAPGPASGPGVDAGAQPAGTAGMESAGMAYATPGGTADAGTAPTGAGAAGAAAAVPLASLERAGFWLRMAALAIDGVIVGVVWSFLPFAGHHSMLLALAAYGAVMWKLRGTTVGGIVCHLAVRRVDGRPLDWSTTIVRALGCFLSLLAAGLGFLWIAFDGEKQAWHDKIAGTVVVRETRPTPLV